jgi:autotransporter-associated beta strand protein
MKFRKRLLLTATVAAASPLTSAHAATATKGATAGANWNDTAAGVWSGGSGTNGAPATGDDVLVTTGSINPTSNVIGGNLSWNKITIDRSTLVTFANSAGSTLNLGAGGISVTSNAAAGSGNSSVQLSAALSLVDQTWTIANTKGIVLNSANYTDGGTARTINIQGATAGSTTGNFRVGGTGNGTVTNTGTWLGTSTVNVKDLSYQLNGSSTNFSNSNAANSGALMTFDNVVFSTGNNASARTLASSTKLLGNISTSNQLVTTGAGYNFIGTMDLDGGTRTITTGTQNTGTFNTLISGVISNGGLTKAGSGTLALSGANTYTGTTTVSAGTLALTGGGSIASSSIIVGATTTLDVSGVTGGFSLASGQTLSGSGTVTGAMTVSGTLSPGNSPGSMTTGNQTWMNGGDYNWQVLDATGTAGSGYDTIAINGTLDLSNLTTANLAINLWSLSSTGPDVNGIALNFSDALNYSWVLASATGGVTGFDATDFVINTTANNGTPGFSNSFTGGFAVAVSGNNLVLNYTAVPEPATALLGGLGLLALLRRRRD